MVARCETALGEYGCRIVHITVFGHDMRAEAMSSNHIGSISWLVKYAFLPTQNMNDL